MGDNRKFMTKTGLPINNRKRKGSPIEIVVFFAKKRSFPNKAYPYWQNARFVCMVWHFSSMDQMFKIGKEIRNDFSFFSLRICKQNFYCYVFRQIYYFGHINVLPVRGKTYLIFEKAWTASGPILTQPKWMSEKLELRSPKRHPRSTRGGNQRTGTFFVAHRAWQRPIFAQKIWRLSRPSEDDEETLKVSVSLCHGVTYRYLVT